MAITSRTVAILLALAMVSVLTIAGTRAAFTASTDNTGNDVATAQILLYDDDSSTVMFNVADMWPGDQVDHCIEVSYEGPSGRATNGVNFYIPSSWTDSNALADDLLITVEEGSAGSFSPAGTVTDPSAYPECTGFTSTATIATDVALSSFGTDYGTGVGTWTPTGSGIGTPVTQAYRITIELDATTDQDNETVTGIPMTWEVQAGS